MIDCTKNKNVTYINTNKEVSKMKEENILEKTEIEMLEKISRKLDDILEMIREDKKDAEDFRMKLVGEK